MEEYTTTEEVENYSLLDIAAEYQDQIDVYIRAMSRYIDKITNRKIFSETESTIKYDGDGMSVLLVQDLVTLTEVKIDGVVTEVLQYPTTKEYTSRIALDDGLFFPRGLQNVEVTAIHAMNSILPEDIKFVCTVLVSGIISHQQITEKDGTTEKIGNYSITYRSLQEKADFKMAKSILSTYKRIAV